ncbi:putative mitochondrial F1F0-ATP synthase g subunit [Xylona heveae TC161]|uniref:Putative mitochondrial F1F0-ATP synthase g subunit n=1 Tax=Xylona heveae (strain CBS 132557 / TC161) TaxID=1328760 RepID=A0A165GEB6_XYLHT|nr:putative mitochondrial F1F0-ATP synthase g subunit [Xylona heveae TC161]KZF22088.1 putative mitochondrial F1F0-ATP synthase g subunit [Xylona heveae TC161]
MSLYASRMVLRQSQMAFPRGIVLRHASTTSEAAQAATSGAAKAQAAASSATSKASQGLSRVSSSAGPILTSAAKNLTQTLGRIGGRTGRVIAFVESVIPPTIYYSKVGIELSKLVFQGQKMSPPSIATFQSYFQPLINAARHPASLFTQTTTVNSTLQPTNILNKVRNLNKQQLVSGGIVAAEVLGFFTVGEILGRFKIVGYRGVDHHAEH